MANKNNKVKYNIKNVYAAKMAETVSNGVSTFTYETPKPIPGAVSLSLDAEGESSPFYADGIVYFRTVTNNGYSGDLEIALIPEWFRTEILQETRKPKKIPLSRERKPCLLPQIQDRTALSKPRPEIPPMPQPMRIGIRRSTCRRQAHQQEENNHD